NGRKPDMTEPDAILVERDGPVTIVSINRPHCRNAVDGATARKLFDAFLTFDADKDSSVAVFTGTHGAFCAGADLKAVAKGDREKKREVGGANTLAAKGPRRQRPAKPRGSDGTEPAAPVKTRDRGGRRPRGGGRHGIGAVGRYARGRGGCDL